MRFLPSFFDRLMRDVPFQFSDMFLRPRASRPQRARFADLNIADKSIKSALDASRSLQRLTGRTNVGSRVGVILEIALLKNALPLPVLLKCRPHILHMRPYLLSVGRRRSSHWSRIARRLQRLPPLIPWCSHAARPDPSICDSPPPHRQLFLRP